MLSRYSILLFMAVIVACGQPKSKDLDLTTNEDSILFLQNENCHLEIDLYGGAFVDFHLKTSTNNVNPFNWKLSKEQMPANNKKGAVFQGHFLCLGRWGQPSAGEMEAGIPHNGEPANSWWSVNNSSDKQLQMSNMAPLDGFSVKRTVSLHEVHPVFKVEEKVKNELSIGRIYNIVQHPTIAPPFLDTATAVYSNAGAGFFQVNALPNPNTLSYQWPMASNDSLSRSIDLQATVNINYVTTHVFSESENYGWVTAYSPTHRLLLGYLWPLADYPWLNVWNHFEDNRPVAKGLEFGTTGIGSGYENLLATNTRFNGHNSFEYIDAGETKQKMFICFMIPVPENKVSIAEITMENGILKVIDVNKKTLADFDINLIL